MKQTAVEWVLEKLTETHTNDEWKKIIKQAKEMEKQQLIDTWDDGFDFGYYYGKYNENSEINSGEEYYNNIFKNKKDEKNNNTDNNSNSRLHL